MVLSLVACSALSYVPILYCDFIDLSRLPVPESTWTGVAAGPVPSETEGRDGWLVLLLGSDGDGNKMETWMVFVAILPALMLLILFFFDHNVSVCL